MGTYLRVPSESYLMIPTLQNLDGFQKSLSPNVLWTKVALALERLSWVKQSFLEYFSV